MPAKPLSRQDGFLPAACFNRASRIIKDTNGYHYKTREGELYGSFNTEAQARFDLNKFIEAAQLQKEFQHLEFSK